MEQSSIRARRAFHEAAGFVRELVEGIKADEWSQPGLGEWTVAELVVHATRAASTIVAYAEVEAELAFEDAAAYYLGVLDGEAIHDAVATRAREQAARIEEPLPEYVAAEFARANEVLERTPAAQVLGTFAGGIRLIDYLPTRVVELVVHGIDLADALDRDVHVPVVAMQVTLETLGDVAVARPDVVDPAQIVRALTGRGSLPSDANLLG